MRIKAALYNAEHQEYGLVSIPFPIPQDEYSETVRMLEALDIGGPRARDCTVEEIEGSVPSLKCLEGRKINVRHDRPHQPDLLLSGGYGHYGFF